MVLFYMMTSSFLEEREESEDEEEEEEKDVSSELVRCSNIYCKFQKWYHLGCVGLKHKPGEVEDWWCSETCRKTKSSPYCVCHEAKEEETVRCRNGDFCEAGQKFHLSCVGLDTHPGIAYYCSHVSLNGLEGKGHKRHLRHGVKTG